MIASTDPLVPQAPLPSILFWWVASGRRHTSRVHSLRDGLLNLCFLFTLILLLAASLSFISCRSLFYSSKMLYSMQIAILLSILTGTVSALVARASLPPSFTVQVSPLLSPCKSPLLSPCKNTRVRPSIPAFPMSTETEEVVV